VEEIRIERGENMWNTMKTLLNNKQPKEDEINEINSYVLIRWLSGNKNTVLPANIINLNPPPIQNQYRFLDDYFQLAKIKNNVKYIHYIKDDKLSKTFLDGVENVQKFYNVNFETAKEYWALMDKKEQKRFKEMYKEGKIN
jgi:intein-encoded DNA endonuclease-like protein